MNHHTHDIESPNINCAECMRRLHDATCLDMRPHSPRACIFAAIACNLMRTHLLTI